MAIRHDHWRERNVLVTGVTGFLGGWLVKELLERRARIVALIRDDAPDSFFEREGLANGVAIVHGSLADQSLLRRTLSEYDIATVFHLAAQAIVSVAQTDPIGTLETNVAGTWNVLEAARHSQVREVVVASSNKAYGPSSDLPCAETHPLEGVYPFDVSKSCVDLVCRMYAVSYGLPVCVTRCGNLFGGGDPNYSRLIPGVIRATHRDERFVIRTDGQFTRDFLYVRDAVAAHLLLAEAMAGDPTLRGEPFNFSLELRITVLEVVEQVLRLMKRTDLTPIIQNIATDEIRHQSLASDKARQVLGWSAQFTMEHGLTEAIEWYTQALKGDAPPKLNGFASL